jgi:DNA sulfur modification protein DndC
MVEEALARMQKHSRDNDLNIDVNLLRPPAEQSFWVNIIGRGYPPPNRTFRWCTQRMKIDPVTVFVQKRLGHWGDAILHLGARRAESATRATTMSHRKTRPRKFGPTCFKKQIRGEATTGGSTNFMQTHRGRVSFGGR